MAKAREIAGLRPEISYADAAAETVRVRARELFEHADGVLDTEDIERVHDMRVASRRLRAALEVYEPCFPRKAYRPVLRDVKRLADALGERRDPDVQLEALKGIGEALPEADHPGLELYAAGVCAEQEAGNVVLAEALRAAEEEDLAGRLHVLAHAAADRA